MPTLDIEQCSTCIATSKQFKAT